MNDAVVSTSRFVQAKGMNYRPFLIALERAIHPDWYLEIGTNRGNSLARVACRSVSIDPRFLLDKPVIGKKPELHMLQMTSDEAFDTGAVARIGARFDLAFLDGMHLFEYLLRDIRNTERHMAENGIICIHDTRPFSLEMAGRKPPGGAWTGDVWKVLPILKEYRPDIEILHLDCGPTGLTMLRGAWGTSETLDTSYEVAVEQYLNRTLEDYGVEAYQDDFPLVRPSTILETLQS